MKSADVRRKFIEFYKTRGHAEIPSAPLVPLNDPTTLFNSSGMQPLVPYLLGEPHPVGKRIVNSQKAIRLQDIDEVGDNRHTTFFEMLGNWSLGDYFKKEQLLWIFEFLTRELGLDPKRLYVTVFEGGESVPKDTESIGIWKEIFSGVGIDAKEGERIFSYPAKKNWWSRSGEPEAMPAGEPGGPDSEVFYDFGSDLKLHERSLYKNEQCHPNCDCGRFMEITNSVFMQYQKQGDGTLKELVQKNVDFGGGLERLTAATIDNPDLFRTDLFLPVIQMLEKLSGKPFSDKDSQTSMRVIADHLKAATFLILEGVLPSKEKQGYIVRKLIRKSYIARKRLGIFKNSPHSIIEAYADIYKAAYPMSIDQIDQVEKIILGEEEKSAELYSQKILQRIEHGLKEAVTYQEKFIVQAQQQYPDFYTKPTNFISLGSVSAGTAAASLASTYGIPVEFQRDIAREYLGENYELNDFNTAVQAYQEAHSESSRTAAAGMFKGGLADKSEQTIKLHTAHHLLLAALQKIVDPSIKQRGSNITAERLRMDFNYAEKLTPEILMEVETFVNGKISDNLPVMRREMPREEAEKLGAQMEFGHKYPDRVSVYFVGSEQRFFSAEFCGGPHVSATGQLGTFKIIKEESAGAGIRRIYAQVE